MMTALVQLAYDPNSVRPGWIALILVAALGLATFLLWRSMNHQLRKIQLPRRDAAGSDSAAAPPPDDDPE